MKSPSDDWEALRRSVLGLGESSLHKTHYPSLRQRLAELERLRLNLQQSEAYLLEAQRLSHTGSFGWNVSTDEHIWSEETFRIFEYDSAIRITRRLVLERVHPQDRILVNETLDQAALEGNGFDIEHRLLMPDGSVRHLHVVARAIRQEPGKVEFVGAVKDITERRSAEEAVRRSEAYLAEAQRLSHTGSFAYNPGTGKILYWSEELFRIFGLEPQQDGVPDPNESFRLLHPEDLDRVSRECLTGFREKAQFSQDYRLQLHDGSVKHLHVIWHPVLDKGGEVAEYVGTAVDVTERKRAEETLRSSESYLAEAQKLTHTGSWARNPATSEFLYCSEEMRCIFGWNPQQGLPTGEMFAQRIHPDDREQVLRKIQNARLQKADYVSDFRIVLPDETMKYIETVVHVVVSEIGEIVEWFGTTMDVTERHQMIRKLKLGEFYLSAGERLSHTGSWSITSNGTCDYWSTERFAIFGFDPSKGIPTIEEYLARVHPDDCALAKGTIDKMLAEGGGFDVTYRIIHPERGLRFVRSVCEASLEDGKVTRFVGTTLDITEQHQARESLEKAFDEIKKLKDELHRENIALKEEIDQASMFEEIVGSSKSLKQVLVNVVQVAPTLSTVLITGETGTGKELIARAIHKRSRRAGRAFVRVNCAAIAPSLIASELFGHERGAFTGAIQRRQGRFELAQGGTIFLDEIGELPEETQVSLLRVLQEREFERVGGSETLRADVRVITATNRDLQAAVHEGKFRRDLYYRLNVFPIAVPPLRERREDIPSLVQAFVRELSRSMGKTVNSIPQAIMDALERYDWPGNIRELRNVIERGMILSRGNTLRVELPANTQSEAGVATTAEPQGEGTLAEVERRHILEVLDMVHWKIGGKDGAASRLGVNRTTLQGRMRRLGIRRPV